MKQLDLQTDSSNLMRTGLEPAKESSSCAEPPTRVRRRWAADGIMLKLGHTQAVVYWGIHVACLAAIWTGVDRVDLALFATTFFVRMFGITGGYHRYFSHRTFRTSRAFQFVLALLATSSVQKGPLWWAANHRLHHRFSDQPGDPHSPREGLWYAHQGWIFDRRWAPTRTEEVKDLARFPELVWLNQWHVTAPILLAVGCYAIGGWSGLVWGFVISTTLTWHITYMINSLTHRLGRQRYETGDDSRNSFIMALLTMGEGWHNNHHYFQSSCRQGFFWWEIDVTYYILRGLETLGIVWALKQPPERVYERVPEAVAVEPTT